MQNLVKLKCRESDDIHLHSLSLFLVAFSLNCLNYNIPLLAPQLLVESKYCKNSNKRLAFFKGPHLIDTRGKLQKLNKCLLLLNPRIQ